MSQDDLKKLNKDKKKVKKLAASYDAFLASASLIKLIPRILGPGLNKAGKFPPAIGASEDIKEKVFNQKCSIKFQLKSKKVNAVGVPIGNVSQKDDVIVNNIVLGVNYLASLLPKGWNNIKRVYVKSTMGPVFKVYGL